MTEVYILGAGNMARETFYLYRDAKREKEIRGFIIQGKKEKETVLLGKPVYDETFISSLPANVRLIAAIGSPLRRQWVQTLTPRFVFDTIIHPSVSLWDTVAVGKGSIISRGAVFTCDIRIGNHTIVNINSNINHDCRIGDYVTIGPGSHIGGCVTIGEGTWISIGTTIIHNRTIGKHAMIAAGAVVVDDVPDSTLAMGVPAKSVRKIGRRDWQSLLS